MVNYAKVMEDNIETEMVQSFLELNFETYKKGIERFPSKLNPVKMYDYYIKF